MRFAIFVLTPLLACVPAAMAVNTSHWVHTSEADFKKGTLRNVVATNLGDVKLSRAIKTIVEQDAKVSAVYSLAEGADGAVYAGTGPHGVVLRIKDGKSTSIHQPAEAVNILSLLVDRQGRLLIGTGGDKGRILRIDKPDAKDATAVEVFAAEGVQYVWAMVEAADGNLYAATGPNGQIFEIKPDGAQSVVLDSDENNILSLIGDGKETLYAGTDPNGLVYRINRKTREMFILFDAAETEVSTLALDAKGNLYAGTAEASETAAALGAAAGALEQTGRPEGTGGVPIPSTPPELPKPPPLPDPNPGEPNPIPKASFMVDGWSRLLNLADDPEDPSPNPNPGPGPGKPMPGKRPNPGGAPGGLGVDPNRPNVPAPPESIDFGKPKAEGNAIYRIDREGFVREIFRQPVMVLCIVERGGVLLIGTGSEGLVYQLDPAAEETSVLAKVDPKQVLSMLATKDGQVLLGMANVGSIASMSAGYAPAGTFTSPVLDATQISRYGKIHLGGSLPEGSSLTIATRSGNVQDPERAGWSNWSEEAEAKSFVQMKSPPARFVQYRLSLKPGQGGAQSPVIDEIDVAYQMPNLAPVVKSVKVGAAAAEVAAIGPAKGTPRNPVETISWEAEDANGDAMAFELYFRTGSKAPWILLKDKLTESQFAWDTRGAADGRYEVKVVASDAAANPTGQGRTGSRVSDPALVDNTAPSIGNVKAEARGTSVRLWARVADRSGTVASMEYTVDSGDDWQAVLPSDNIFDSPEETVDITLSRLTPGAHQITLRATDAKGNAAHETVQVTIEAAAVK